MNQYIGLPYSFRNFNCWDFVVKVRHDLGLRCEVFRPKKLRQAFSLIDDAVIGDHAGLSRVDSPDNYDIILVRKDLGQEHTYHCGIFYNGLVYHCDRSKGQVSFDKYKNFIKPYASVSFWR